MLARVFVRAPTAVRVARRGLASATNAEIALLKELLAKAQERELAAARAAAAAAAAEAGGNRFQIQTFDKISPSGLERFPATAFMLTGSSGKLPEGTEPEPHAILLRSHKLAAEEVKPTVRAIARCGAGTNNIPIEEMTKVGIPVFNTPGANANSVKELVLAGLLLASRDIVGGILHTKNKIVPEEKEHKKIEKRIEKDKSLFGGQELLGKTLGICGLGNIGAMVAESALALGMKVVGYDPKLSVDAAWRLSSKVERCDSLEDVFSKSDYVSVNMPYIKGVTHGAISAAVLAKMKPTCHLLNFARGEIVDGQALLQLYENGHKGRYICDFADEGMQNHPKFMCIPHLGASTEEAEDNCAAMAANQVINFLETGSIINSVNFPTAHLAPQKGHTRLCIVNQNIPGVLGAITTLMGQRGINIAQQLNTSRDKIAYNVLDLQDFPEDADKSAALQKELASITGVLSTRLIWTGSVSEGPSNFVSIASQGAAQC